MAIGSTNAIGPVDDVPTLGSTNLVKSGGVADQLVYYLWDYGSDIEVPVTWTSATASSGGSSMSVTQSDITPIRLDDKLVFFRSVASQPTAGGSISGQSYTKKISSYNFSNVTLDWAKCGRLPSNANGYLTAYIVPSLPGGTSYSAYGINASLAKAMTAQVTVTNGQLGPMTVSGTPMIFTRGNYSKVSCSLYWTSTALDNLTFS